MSDERVTVDLTDEEVGVRRESSDFEERAAFAAFSRAGEGNYRLHDIEPIEGGVRVHLRRVEEKVATTAVDEIVADAPVCGCEDCHAEEEAAAELTPEQINPILGLSVDDDRSMTLDAGEVCALIEVIEFAGNILPRIPQFPFEGRSLPVSIERLKLRLGLSGFLGYAVGVLPDGSRCQVMRVMPYFEEQFMSWLEAARAEYDRQNPQRKIVEVHRTDAGLRAEE